MVGAEKTTTEAEPTSPELIYPNVEIFYKIRAENPDLTFDEAYNQFVVGGGRSPSPPGSSNGSGSDSSDSKLEEEPEYDMADNRERDPPTVHNWLDEDVVAVPGPVHNLPRHPEEILPIFNPDEKQPTEEHLKQFKMKVRLLNVRHEDVICRLFPYTFTGKASTRYFSLP